VSSWHATGFSPNVEVLKDRANQSSTHIADMGHNDTFIRQELQKLSDAHNHALQHIQSIDNNNSRVTAQLVSHKEQLDRQSADNAARTLDERKERLIRALAVPEMMDRLNFIKDRVSHHENVYQRVFHSHESLNTEDKLHQSLNNGDEPGGPVADQDRLPPDRNRFLNWLRSGHGIFWISGLAGSGKSTLMSTIYEGLRPYAEHHHLLSEWAVNNPVKVMGHFFRSSSSSCLKSMQGLWRSLCSQILDLNPFVRDLQNDIQCGRPSRAPPGLISSLRLHGSSLQSWSNQELEDWFDYMVLCSPFAYCLIIDGLDEVEENQDGLIDALQRLARRHSNLKICCVSRPENRFVQAFNDCPMV
jgi:hypothetical protein